MDRRLLDLAIASGGVFTAGQAAGLGADEHALVRAVRSGEAVRVRRNAYVLGDHWSAAGPQQQLLLRTRAVLASRGGAASHDSALALHGTPTLSVSRSVDVLGPVARTRTRSGVRVHPGAAFGLVPAGGSGPEGAGAPPASACAGLESVDGYLCVPLPVAIVQVAARSGLLAGLVPADSALHAHRVTLDALTAAGHLLCEQLPAARRPGCQRELEHLVTRADPACESPGETRTRVLLADMGFNVRSQVTIRERTGRFVARVDFLLGSSVVVEFDGRVKYAGADGPAALMAEKVREDRLRSLGYEVVRLTWGDLRRPDHVAALVRDALRRAYRAA